MGASATKSVTAGKIVLFGASAVGFASLQGMPPPTPPPANKPSGPKVCAFTSADDASIDPGYKVYKIACANCH
ncbi:Hypp7718 [Branchiostoma lanceolatum]|uniref:Hypp7718 protein n=1 Tax=Branchiostoma lanceolatum TaxID=7740 RepID=A0A8J9Z2D6_BRALA|nr:Hypp7718 [Branchiostoma lanceolatum]